MLTKHTFVNVKLVLLGSGLCFLAATLLASPGSYCDWLSGQCCV